MCSFSNIMYVCTRKNLSFIYPITIIFDLFLYQFVEQYAAERVVRMKNAEVAYFKDNKRLKLSLSSSISSNTSSSSENVTAKLDITTITTTMPSDPAAELAINRYRRGRSRPLTQPSESQSQPDDQIAPAMVCEYV